MNVQRIHVWKTERYNGQPRWVIDIEIQGDDHEAIKILSDTQPQFEYEGPQPQTSKSKEMPKP